MSIKLYDDALLAKLRSWSDDVNLKIIKSDEASHLFELWTMENNDKSLKLPIIAVKRVGGYSLVNPNRTVMSALGLTYHATAEKSLWLNAIPIHLEYQIDIYTRYLEEADEYMRNIIFNAVNYPRLTIEIPYMGEHILHDSSIHIDPAIMDNSSVPERLIVGEFTRLTCRIVITDAYIWDVRVKDNYSIDVDVAPVPNNREELKRYLATKIPSNKFKIKSQKIGYYKKGENQ